MLARRRLERKNAMHGAQNRDELPPWASRAGGGGELEQRGYVAAAETACDEAAVGGIERQARLIIL
jgi:hypothetical protein